MPQISRGEHGINNRTYKEKDLQKNKKNEVIMTCTPHITCDDSWTSRKPSHLTEPVTPSLVTTEQAQATTTKTNILLVIQK
jgi:hypothetical protein